MSERRPSRGVLAVAALLLLLLVATSGRYGYHRDELYFLAAGQHLAWGYPDMPPLVPLLARLADEIAPGSLVVLRLPSALAIAALVLVTDQTARVLGADRRGRLLASALIAVAGFPLALGHLLSTATFGLLGWAVALLLMASLLVDGGVGRRRWIALGLVVGLTAQANVLVGVLPLVVAAGVLAVGPRRLLLRWEAAGAAAIAAACVAPYLIWQAQHGWPQLAVARGISAGSSGTSEPRWLVLPLFVLQSGPWLLPVVLTGCRVLARRPEIRALAAGAALLVALVLVGGGKPYYLAGFLPLLLAAGATVAWRPWAGRAMVALSLPALLFVLPVLPVEDAGTVIAVNADAGETIGWPAYVDQIAAAYESAPPGTQILTANYGEAGAIDRFGPSRGLPRALSGHLGYAAWGHPSSSTVLTVGLTRADLLDSFARVEPRGSLATPHGIDNDEDGAPLFLCSEPLAPWPVLWPRFERDR